MNAFDLMAIYRVFHESDHATIATLQLVMDPEIGIERMANWIDGNLDRVRGFVDKLIAVLDGLGDIFETTKPSGVDDLRASLVEVLAKIDEAEKLRRQNEKAKPRKKKVKVGDPNQGDIFAEIDEDDPIREAATGDPG